MVVERKSEITHMYEIKYSSPREVAELSIRMIMDTGGVSYDDGRKAAATMYYLLMKYAPSERERKSYESILKMVRCEI